MSDARLTKFISDQEAAVEVARSVSGEPAPYNIRADAINAALSLVGCYSGDPDMARVIADARVAEAYLKGQ